MLGFRSFPPRVGSTAPRWLVILVFVAAGGSVASNLGGAATPLVAGNPTSTVGTIKTSVPSTSAWSVNVPVTKGEKLALTASGEVNYCAGDPRCRSTPDGSVAGESICGTPPICGALIGRFDQGTPFLVGRSKELTAAANGKLYLGVNDQPGYYSDNVGAFTVTIKTTGEATPPQVRVFPFPSVTKPGERIKLEFSVKDASGRARAYANLYEGGRLVGSANKEGTATGQTWTWTATLPTGLKGPLYFCAWASNAAGKRTDAYAACTWISLVVPIARVSNGCGGGAWDKALAVQNRFGNKAVYVEPGYYTVKPRRYIPEKRYEVNFVDACNLHDAGYGGRTVNDVINGGPPIDYRTWTRRQIDNKFNADMRSLCRQQIPASAKQARRACENNFRYRAVQCLGHLFYDADVTVAKTQPAGTASSRPWGGVRRNDPPPYGSAAACLAHWGLDG